MSLLRVSFIDLNSHLSLFTGSGVLLENALSRSLINRLDSGTESGVNGLFIALDDSGIEFLDGGLHIRLDHFIAKSSGLGGLYSLLSRLDVRQN